MRLRDSGEDVRQVVGSALGGSQPPADGEDAGGGLLSAGVEVLAVRLGLGGDPGQRFGSAVEFDPEVVLGVAVADDDVGIGLVLHFHALFCFAANAEHGIFPFFDLVQHLIIGDLETAPPALNSQAEGSIGDSHIG